MRKFTKPGLRTLALAVSSGLLASFAVIGTAADASASATGCARWGAKKIAGYSIPTGQYCFSVGGSGLYINGTSGSFDTGMIQWPTEKVSFYDTSGNNYATYTTFQGQGTNYGYHAWTTGIHGNARIGSVCGQLLSNGQTLVTVCENIHA